MELFGVGNYSAVQSSYAPKKRETAAKTVENVSFFDMAKTEASQKTESTASIESASLETMLKAKYPNLAYHVADLSSSLWRTRNDYPHELIFQQRSDIAEKLENWKPSGPNPQYSWFRGPLASKAVVVHPDAQKHMESDPEFAKEVMARIEVWWALDNARNEALSPGWTATMSQGVVIGKDGSIVNAVSGGGGGGGRITYSVSGDSWWDLRAKRHNEYMKLWQERQLDHQAMLSAQAARSNLLEMMNDDLLHTLGDTVAGVSTRELFDLIRQEAISV